MKFNMLGSGGVYPPPRPCCNCKICKEAREKGIPYHRTGTSLYNYNAKLLFDLPEEIREQLNREKIDEVKNVIITHWHPDHTLGLRIFEQLNFKLKEPIAEPINVFISQFQLDMLKKLSCGGFLEFYENQRKIIKLNVFKENEILEFGSLKIIPRLIEHTKGFYFEIIENDKRLVYAPCEYHEFKVHEESRDIDIFIAHHLFFEDKSIGNPEFDFPEEEDSFEEMLEHAKEMGAKKIIITHIEESIDLNHDELNTICKEKFSTNIDFGYDGMIIDL